MNAMQVKPKISVVFTSYNHKEYLRQALDAIICQTFNEFELIIVDDSSTDGSQDVLKEYAKKDSRIRLYLNEKNSGSYVNSTNYGVSLAVAPYIVLAQCDDFAFPNQLQELYDARVANKSYKVVFSSSFLVNESGQTLDLDYNLRSRKFKEAISNSCVIESTIATELLLNECIIPNLGAAMVDRSLYNEVDGLSTSYKVLADWDFWLKCSVSSGFIYIKSPLNNFRQHNTTIRSSIKTELQLDELYSIFTEFKDKNNSLTLYDLNKSIGFLFWGMVTPISIGNFMDVLWLSIMSIKFHLTLPLFIYWGALSILLKKIIRKLHKR